MSRRFQINLARLQLIGAFSLVLAMFLCTVGCLPNAPKAEKAGWKLFSHPEKHYSVLLPGPARPMPSDRPTLENYGIELASGRVYMISECKLSDSLQDPVKSLMAARDAMVGTDRKLFDREISFEGEVGRDLAVIDSDDDTFRARVFIKDNTLYQLHVFMPKGTYVEDDLDIALFFDSFRVGARQEGADETPQSPRSGAVDGG